MKNQRLFWHVLFWLVYMAIFTFVEGGYNNKFNEAFYLEISYLPLRLILVYFNFFYLLPRYLLKKKIQQYIILTLFTIVLASLVQRTLSYYVVNPVVFPDWDQNSIFEPFRIVQATMILASPMIFLIGLTIVFRWSESEHRIQKLAKEKVETELKYLKNQVNPHFFFNTLNNLYGLAQEKSDHTPDVVLKLSDLMSYMLYETNKELIDLSKEVEYIKNYIGLEEQRFGDRFKCDFRIIGSIKDVKIPPMLILPFVENSFKHGINKESEGAWLRVEIEIRDQILSFKVENSIVETRTSDSERGGLGIKNVERRLELLYPEAHELKYGYINDRFSVSLTLGLLKLKMSNDAL